MTERGAGRLGTGQQQGPEVLFEDHDLLVVLKPAGWHTAPQPGRPPERDSGPGGREEGTLLDWLLSRYPEVAALPARRSGEPGLLHRLDRETSGAVVVARTAAAFEALAAQLARGGVRKQYLALCLPGGGRGPAARSPGRAEAAAGRARGRLARPGALLQVRSRFAAYGPGRRMVRVVAPELGRGRGRRRATSAVYETRAEVLEARGPLALVRAALTRGFRHQVRVHLACLGLPILGDPLYGPASEAAPPGLAGEPSRMYLHAWVVELAHPASGRPLRVESAPPPEFEQLLRRFQG